MPPRMAATMIHGDKIEINLAEHDGIGADPEEGGVTEQSSRCNR